ncbi:MAG: NADH:flavin oxidoreductase/NADH oxidase [Actinobacteria bacterium]|nr:NADH:flavin oxidoreductase/NADH oxidase [Actinomycetota bacterium]
MNSSAPLFQEIQIRDLTISNRIWVSPMCQYSATDGLASDWHRVHLGAFATGGAGLTIVEATGVVPEGRISVGCLGIWSDEHAHALQPMVDFAHSQGVAIGIQLAHAGRKGSTMRPWDDHLIASPEEGGWQTVSASEIAFHGMPTPHALSINEIAKLVESFATAALRAVNVGFDVIELHAAHGYLFHQFFSPLSNNRTDEYGGDFAGRTKFLLQTVKRVREVIPQTTPLFVRISATDWVEGGWTIEDSIQLAKELQTAGVDLIDVSSGGIVHNATIPFGPSFQVPLAEAIKQGADIPTSAVGLITDAQQANEIVSSNKADAVMMGRVMLRNPRWPLAAAETLNEKIAWPKQLERARTLK